MYIFISPKRDNKTCTLLVLDFSGSYCSRYKIKGFKRISRGNNVLQL